MPEFILKTGTCSASGRQRQIDFYYIIIMYDDCANYIVQVCVNDTENMRYHVVYKMYKTDSSDICEIQAIWYGLNDTLMC